MAWAGLDLKTAADHFQAFPHAEQPEVFAALPMQYTIHLKGFAVIFCFHANAVGHSSALLGVHKQQHDPAADECKSRGRLRDKVMVGGLKNAQAAEIDCFSRGREGDARVTKCDNA
jgi:hypothetical protein